MKNPWQISAKSMEKSIWKISAHASWTNQDQSRHSWNTFGTGGETMGREGRGVGKMATSVWRLNLQDLGRFRMICVKHLSRTNFLFDHQWVSTWMSIVEFWIRGCWKSKVFALHYKVVWLFQHRNMWKKSLPHLTTTNRCKENTLA